MTFRDLLTDTLRTLWAHKLRTGLTMFGIAWGVIAITLMVAAGEGLREGQRKNSETFGKNIMIINAGRTSLQAGGMRAGRTLMWMRTTTITSSNPHRIANGLCLNRATPSPSGVRTTAPLCW